MILFSRFLNFFILVFMLNFDLIAQTFVSVQNPTVLPNQPSTSSNIKIATRVTTPSIGWKVSSNYNILSSISTIELKGSYCDGLLPGGIPINDTLSIGNLAVGVWTVNFRAYYGSQFLTNCGITDSVLKTVTFTISLTNSIKDDTTPTGFSIYPTLVINDLKIDVIDANAKLPIEVVVINCIGEIIESYSLSNKTNLLNLAHLKSGIYFVKLKSDSSTSIKKIIKD